MGDDDTPKPQKRCGEVERFSVRKPWIHNKEHETASSYAKGASFDSKEV
jgi:hypothetical protein